MREILFRGVCTETGDWVKGRYVRLFDDKGNRYHRIYPGYAESDCGDLYPDWYEVDHETVGQYTGLTDKNGKKVFEGDIVNAVIVRDLGGGTENREETGIIGYDKIGMIGLIAKYAGTIPVWSDFFQELTLSGCINDFWFEVIGNIHDNPELLEGGAEDG